MSVILAMIKITFIIIIIIVDHHVMDMFEKHKVCSFHLFKCWTSYHTDCICDNNHHSIISFSSLFFFFRVEKEVDFFSKYYHTCSTCWTHHQFDFVIIHSLVPPLLRKRTREENMKNWQTNKKKWPINVDRSTTIKVNSRHFFLY